MYAQVQSQLPIEGSYTRAGSSLSGSENMPGRRFLCDQLPAKALGCECNAFLVHTSHLVSQLALGEV